MVCVALFEYLSMAFASIKSNKMRSLLTMLGIIIGIAAVIAIETVGNSLSSSVSDSMSGTGQLHHGIADPEKQQQQRLFQRRCAAAALQKFQPG